MSVYLYWICGGIITLSAIMLAVSWAAGVPSVSTRDVIGFTLMAIGLWITTP